MSITRSIAVVAASALLAIPSVAVAVGPPRDPGTPGPDASPSVKAKAYGHLCAAESKKHVAGEKGTPFSRCVTAMAKAASGEAKTARAACAGLSRKHTAGEHGSPYSRCISAASRLTHRPGSPASA
jgi:hypothetical protein